MKKRQIIILAIAVAVLVAGKLSKDFLAKPTEKKARKTSTSLATVFTEKVENDTIPVFVESTGVLEAVNRLDLFSEVQGVMEADNGRFKAGNSFKKGDLLISIRSNDQKAQLFSQRSTFESALMAIMPDLKADYPEEFPTWQTYLSKYSADKPTAELPSVKSDKLKSFLVGKAVYSNFHSLKNMEIINTKYRLRAPYDGTLISTNVDPGTLVRPGQALGVFIQPLNYEVEVSIDAITAERLKVGQSVDLWMQGAPTKKWQGKISRLVKAIDKESQMSTFFVSVQANDLKEGMFVQVSVKANDIPNAFEISRTSLVNNNQLYVVENDQLVLNTIKIEFLNRNSVIISGLEDKAEVLTKVPPSAFEGMKVSIYKED